MAKPQKSDYEKTQTILSGWKNIRPNKSFAGLTLAEFEQRISPIKTTRDDVTEREDLLKAAINARDAADKAAFAEAQLVVNSVRSDRHEGEDGELYEAMGYVRKSERKTGLSRKARVAETTAKA
jgi:hypothetical protein